MAKIQPENDYKPQWLNCCLVRSETKSKDIVAWGAKETYNNSFLFSGSVDSISKYYIQNKYKRKVNTDRHGEEDLCSPSFYEVLAVGDDGGEFEVGFTLTKRGSSWYVSRGSSWYAFKWNTF